MGKSASSKQQVTDYKMSIHFGVAVGPFDALTGLYIDSKTVWEGEISTQTDIAINDPQLFGGPTAQGGAIGRLRYFPGGPTQVLPDDVVQKFDASLTGATAPSFRGMASIFLTGQDSGGFTWSSNNPVIAQKVDVRGRRIPKVLDPTIAQIAAPQDSGYAVGIGANTGEAAGHAAASINASSLYFTATESGSSVLIKTKRPDNTYAGTVDATDPTSGNQNLSISDFVSNGAGYQATLSILYLPAAGNTFTIGPETFTFDSAAGPDSNPAHIIYEILTNDDWGMGYTSDLIDVDAFNYAGSVLFSEGLGLSLMWSQQATIEDFINEILNHIVGTIFVRPSTGLITLKLIRGDYDPTTLQVFDPSNANLTNYQRKLWGETINEIVVSWTNPINEQSETVIEQDLANIAIQGGTVSDPRNFYGVRNQALASKLALRELRSVSAPLWSMQLTVDRDAWNTEPGDCVLINWPEENLVSAIGRVGSIDFGTIDSGAITVSLVQDVFSLDRRTSIPAPATAWSNPGSAPAALTLQQVSTLPAYFAYSGELQAKTIDLTYPEVLGMVFAYSPDRDVSGYDLYADTVQSTGATTFANAGTKAIVERSVLSVALTAQAVSTFPASIVVHADRGPQVGGFVFLGAGDTAQEIAFVASSDGENWTIDRGVLDTVPQAWPVGTPIWYVNPGLRLVEDQTIRSAAESVQYKLLTRTSQGVLDIGSAPEIDTTLTARPHLPLRPANVKVNGVGFGPVAVGTATSLTITWSPRNRTLEDGQVVLWTDGPIGGEYGQQTVVTVRDPSSSIVYQQFGLWTDTELDLPVSYFARYPSVTITVSSLMNGLASLQFYTLQVTGLPNNGSAPFPPAAPTPGPEPSPIPAPGAGAWAATGSAVTSAGGESVPAINIAGASDNASATGIVVRYKQATDTNWTVHPLISLAGFNQTNITGVAANTAYDVEMAYEATYGSNGVILSQWLAFSPVTTGDATVANAAALAGVAASEVLNNIETALSGVSALTTTYGSTASAADSAVSAATSATVAAQIGTGAALNVDPTWQVWSGTVSPINTWLNNIAVTKQTSNLLYGAAALNIAATSAQTDSYLGMYPSCFTAPSDLNYIVFEWEVTLNSGDFSQAGFGYEQIYATSGYKNAAVALFTQHPSPVSGQTYRGSQFYSLSSGSPVGAIQTTYGYVFGNAAALDGGAPSTKNFTVHRLTIRPAKDSEIAAQAASENVVTAQAQITSYQEAQAAATAAQAATNTSLSAQVGTLSGSVAVHAETLVTLGTQVGNVIDTTGALGTQVSTLGQVYSTYGLTVNANGAFASFVEYAASGPISGTGVIFDADNFQIKSSTHPAVQPFDYDADTGTLSLQNLSLSGSLIVDGTITTPNLAPNSVSTRIVSAATSSVSGSDSAGLVVVFSHSFTLTSVADVTVLGSVKFDDTSSGESAGYHDSEIQLTINGTIVGDQVGGNILATTTMSTFGALTELPVGDVVVNLLAKTRSEDSYTNRTLITEWVYK